MKTTGDLYSTNQSIFNIRHDKMQANNMNVVGR